MLFQTSSTAARRAGRSLSSSVPAVSADVPCAHPVTSTADSFNRWEAGQVLARKLLLALYGAAMDSNKGELGTEEDRR